MEEIKKRRIDWINHLVTLISTLLGIFIAFQLENYRDNLHDSKVLKEALQAIHREIDSNRLCFKSNIDELSEWLQYWDFINNDNKGNGMIILNPLKMDSMAAQKPSRFKSLKLIKKINETSSLYYYPDPIVDVRPHPDISTSNWQSAISLGILNKLDQPTLNHLTQIYEWTMKEIGVKDYEFYNNVISNQYTDLSKMVEQYRIIVRTYSFKIDIIDENYQQINW